MPRLKDRRILITGAAMGIGQATARLFRGEGAQVAMLDRDAAALAPAARELGAQGFACDVADAAAVEKAVDDAARAMGGIDGVVNCAGISQAIPFGDITLERWQQIIGVNLTGTFLVCRSALPWLRKNERATIVNLASAQALLPTAGSGVGYAASKGGVMLLSKALAAELAPAIRVNVICPGITDTPMVKGVMEQSAGTIEGVYAGNMIKRPSSPEEQAQAILFLTSHESSFVDGVVLAVDGGRSRH
jgi:NAD(P)-dependent dehydrogenase (short-subunit alcohol dehydrogenase family)